MSDGKICVDPISIKSVSSSSDPHHLHNTKGQREEKLLLSQTDSKHV